MLNLNLKNNKFLFLLNFRLIFLNFKYLGFININFQNHKNLEKILNALNIHFLKGNELVFLYKYNHFLKFLKNDYILVYSNNFLKFPKTLKFNAFSFLNYFVNNKHIIYLYNYHVFYSNNYNAFIVYILQYINKYICIIYIYLFKVISLILKLGLKKIL